jgi:hypothetical protein
MPCTVPAFTDMSAKSLLHSTLFHVNATGYLRRNASKRILRQIE